MKEQNNLTVVNKNFPEAQEITKEKIGEYLNAFGMTTQLKKAEQVQFIEIAHAYQLNPFKREIYCVPYESNIKDQYGKWVKERRLSIITGYETFLKRAERTNKLNGWSVKTDGQLSQVRKMKYEKEVLVWSGNMRAIVTIHRKDWTQPLIHEVHFSEYNQENKMWNEKPHTMIKKVAIAQAFRLAFPDELGGIPYTSDELPDNMTGGETFIHPEPTQLTEPDKKAEPIDAEIVESEQTKEPKKPESTTSNQPHKITEGEPVPKWYWSMSSAEKAKWLDSNCVVKKVNNEWVAVRKAS